ncbi:MAG TPA: chromate transporter [Symbiobacteriaceae bacterium]|nr:chromate transporter [Symbiobacteriaceae bacterium]
MKKLWQIARMGLLLGATVFGGVAAAYPRVRERCTELGEITAEEVDGLYALAVVLPGPSFLNLWGAVSARTGGLIGAVVGEIALLLPAVVLVLALPLTTVIPWIGARTEGALNGSIYATAGLLLATGIEAVRKHKGYRPWLITALGLGALLAGVHPVFLLILVLGWGAL